MPEIRKVPKTAVKAETVVKSETIVKSDPSVKKSGVRTKKSVVKEVKEEEVEETDVGTDGEETDNELPVVVKRTKAKKSILSKDKNVALTKLITADLAGVYAHPRVLDVVSRIYGERLYDTLRALLEEVEPRKRKAPRAPVDPDAPKAPLGVFFAFLRDHKDEVAKRTGLGHTDLNKHMARLWKEEVDEAVKSKYSEDWFKANEAFKIEKKIYQELKSAQVTDADEEEEAAPPAKRARTTATVPAAKPSAARAKPATAKSKSTPATSVVENENTSPKKSIAVKRPAGSPIVPAAVIVPDDQEGNDNEEDDIGIEEDQGEEDEEMDGNPSDEE